MIQQVASAMNMVFMVLVCALLFVWTLKKIKDLFLVASISISREIEPGESNHIGINLYAFETKERRIEKYFDLVAVSEHRKKFCHDRFLKLVEEEQAKNASNVREMKKQEG